MPPLRDGYRYAATARVTLYASARYARFYMRLREKYARQRDSE